MMSYCVLTSFCLLSLATAQTVMRVTSCLTKDNNLHMNCYFSPASGTSLPLACTFTTEGKVVASTNNTLLQDSTFKKRAQVVIVDQVCQLDLTGLADNESKIYNCKITQNGYGMNSTVDKKLLPTCSAWSVLQHSGVPLLLALLTHPLFSELL